MIILTQRYRIYDAWFYIFQSIHLFLIFCRSGHKLAMSISHCVHDRSLLSGYERLLVHFYMIIP